jgi:hypothetical protein
MPLNRYKEKNRTSATSHDPSPSQKDISRIHNVELTPLSPLPAMMLGELVRI